MAIRSSPRPSASPFHPPPDRVATPFRLRTARRLPSREPGRPPPPPNPVAFVPRRGPPPPASVRRARRTSDPPAGYELSTRTSGRPGTAHRGPNRSPSRHASAPHTGHGFARRGGSIRQTGGTPPHASRRRHAARFAARDRFASSP